MVHPLKSARCIVPVLLALAGPAFVPHSSRAADVPLRAKPVAQESVRTCPEYGPGFFQIPGSDVCLKASFDLTLETKVDMARQDIYIETARVIDNPVALYDKQKFARENDRSMSRVDPRLNFMTVTKVGDSPLITYFSLRSSPNQTAANTREVGADHGHSLYLDQAWIKYKGVTAGRHASFFDFLPGYTYVGGYASQRNLNLFAYTQSFGSQASVSVSVEDGLERRVQDGVWSVYSGQRMPDLVAQARFTPSWGILHAGAALHQITDALGGRTSYGYAVNSGVEYKQKWADLFGAGTTDTYGRFLLSGAYTRGALDYLGIPKFGTDYVSDFDGRLDRTSGYSAVASYEHVWTPTFKTTVSHSIFSVSSTLTNFTFKANGSVTQFGAEYMPAPGLMVGVELDYYRDSVRGIYFGTAGERDKVGNMVGFAYIRRRI